MSPVILVQRQATDPSVSFSGTSFGYPARQPQPFPPFRVVRKKQKPIGLRNRVARAFRQSIRLRFLFRLILRPYGTGPWLRPAALGIFRLSWGLRGERVSEMAARYSDQPVAELTPSPSGSESRWSYSELRLDHSEEQCR